MPLSNSIPMVYHTKRPMATHLRVARTLQRTGTWRLGAVLHSVTDFTTMGQIAPIFQARTDLRLETCSLRMRIRHRLHLVVRSLQARDHIQWHSLNLRARDQGHRPLQQSQASTLVYHSLCKPNLRTLRQPKLRSLESTINWA